MSRNCSQSKAKSIPETWLNNAKRALKSRGYRLTPQRILLLKLVQSSGGHLDADRLYRLTRRANKRVSLSTIYRTLSLLKMENLTDELHLGEEHHHYEPKEIGRHHHLLCTKCGEVIEFDVPLVKSLERTLSKEYDFQITNTQVEIQGYCKRCQKQS